MLESRRQRFFSLFRFTAQGAEVGEGWVRVNEAVIVGAMREGEGVGKGVGVSVAIGSAVFIDVGVIIVRYI